MILIKKAQFSVIELIFLILLFSLISSYIFFDFKISHKDYNVMLETGLDSIYYSEGFREEILAENLGVEGLTQDWTLLNQTLSKMFNKFEFIILSSSDSKIIFSCGEISGKLFDERIISIDGNGDNYDFRKIRLGVCY